MKTQNKALTATLMGAAVYAGAAGLISYQYHKIGELEKELERAQQRIVQKVVAVEMERDNYRKRLIQHGNPEGWQLSGDSLTGEVYYTRLNGDAIGNCWTEYLK